MRREPRTKAEWLRTQFYPDDPTFPLDAEIIASIPEHLVGPVPESFEELYANPRPDREEGKPSDAASRQTGETLASGRASRPRLVLLPAGMPTEEQLLAFFTQLTGRKATSEEVETLRCKLAGGGPPRERKAE